MKSTAFKFSSGFSRMMILYLMLLVSYARTQGEDSFDRSLVDEDPFVRPLGPLTDSYGRSLGPAENEFARSLGAVENSFARSLGARYIGNGMHVKGGWRPVMAGGSPSFVSDTGHKVFSGPAHLETKAYNVHGFGLSAHGSTSSRPLNTRDVNKISNIAQTYKPSIYPQSGVNLNAPVNSYLNPFAFTSNSALNPYKLSPGFHFDNNVYLKQQTSHRPYYTKQPQQQLLLGMRVKPNQYQIMQQHPSNQFHHQQQQQQLPSYQQQVNVKKPIETYSRPSDNYNQYHHHESHPKPNEHKFPVNPQESLNKQTQQTKTHASQSISAVTYKPPTSAHFPQFGVNEDSFAPIPSSILGSFSSFGHASVKARDPPQFNSKNQYSTIEPTKAPEASTVTKDYVSSSTAYTEVKIPPKDPKATSTVNHHYNKGVKDDYKDSLVPPPQINKPANNDQNYRNPSTERNNPYKDNFIPSPVDPLSKGQTKVEVSKFPSSNIKYVDKPNKSTKRPIVTSFFDSNIISPSTIGPYEAHSTHAIPDNLIVQLPSPQSPFNSFGGQSNKVKHQKDKHQVFSSVNHNAVTTKYSAFDDVQHFPSHEFYDNNFNKNKNPPKHSYEVTEGWEPFGEDPTQPSIHLWGHPSQTFKQYNNVLGPPNGINKAVPTFYPPTISPNNADINAYSDVSTIFSIVSESNQQHDIHGLENSLTSPGPQGNENSEQSNKQIVISPSPNYINMNTDRPRITTDGYQETTTAPPIFNSRRKPSRYRTQQETTTEDFKDVTTRFETYKENVQESGNDLLANDLATIPPNKHFKRPLTATTTSYPVEEEDKLKKRNKNRRRRPLKSTSPTSDDIAEESVTENSFKLQRERTTTILPEIEETTKLPRNRLRFPQKVRPTRPSSQPELTSSAQPTVIPTHPVTLRSKFNSRIRTTTQSSLDFDESIETTTIRDKHTRVHEKQSSIMKIAKENHLHRPSVIKYSSSFGTLHDAPDYSHKQDEKDTPTSDISLHLSENKYSAQKENNLSFTDLFMDLDSEVQQSAQDTFISPTTTLEPSEQTEQHATQLALSDGKTGVESTQNNEEVLNPTDGENNKKSKLYGNRPRFSVKDYRNRLNQYTSSSTEKPTQAAETSPRLRFPNRSRFTNTKDTQPAASEVDNATEQPRKKFLPKDSKHKANESNLEKGTHQKTNSSLDNEFALKASNKFRSSLRRDPNKQVVGTTVIPELTDKPKLSVNLKRPSIIRKRVQAGNKTEAAVETLTETPTTTEKIILEQVIENVTSTEKSTSETAIMKIARDDKKHASTENGSSSDLDQSQRVADLTLAASKDYDTPGMFKSVSPNSRRVVPNYFTIATDDPILPIEAFFPQLNQKKES